MKAIIAAAVAALTIASLASAADAHPHRVCMIHHHHRVCHYVR